MTQDQIEKIYDDEKARLTEEFLKKKEKGMSSEEADRWMRKKLKNARDTFYMDCERELKTDQKKEEFKKRFKNLIEFIERLRAQFQ